MIYTYDKITGQVVMVSEGKNQYTNPDWYDVEADNKALETWKTTEGGSLYKQEDTIVVLDANNEVVFTEDGKESVETALEAGIIKPVGVIEIQGVPIALGLL